uniref:CCR4-NOT transcription complex subunit 1 n=1 Tax=Romanomermis culicivorax TaxID=13658 RepID=A0A915LAQ2_ROMCU
AESVPAQLNAAAAGSLFNNANDFPGHSAAAVFFGNPNFNTTTQASQQPLVTSNEPNNPDITQSFTDDIQGEANNYFQQIYAQPPQPSMSIEQFLEVLKRFRDSTEKKQLDVFACMIKNLFEEYNFFEQYPEKELHTTALLFGGVLREGLVSGTPLVVALRIVAEALKKEPGARLFNFGVVALDQFKTRLKEYPRYCQNILPTVSRNLPPRLLDYVQHGIREEWPPSHQSAVTRSVTPACQSASVVSQTPTTFVTSMAQSGTAKPAPTLNATNIDTLVHATDKEDSKVAVPPENIVEKVAFLFNNLSQMNMLQKVSEMKGMMVDEHLPWLAQYLVMKRVSAESNFHNLYATFVTALGNRTLNAIILKETYRNIKVTVTYKILLRSDKAAANFSDRTLLKNLGHWLGMVTLMVNKPILHRDLDVKSLLLEAFWKGQQELLYVVPFLAKILESCQKSK